MMADEFIDPDGGEIVPETAIKSRRATEVVAAVRGPGLTYASLVECRTGDGEDTIVLDVEVERPQRLTHDIRKVERLAVRFFETDDAVPQVLALRRDFPHTQHQNQCTVELPRSLCLYARPWEEVRLTWTAQLFLARIRWWLSRTASGSLHAEGQALESFVAFNGLWLVLPSVIKAGSGAGRFAVVRVGDEGSQVYVCQPLDAAPPPSGLKALVLLRVECPVRTHGVLRRVPRTIGDLATLVNHADFDMIVVLRDMLRKWPESDLHMLGHNILLLLELPKSRLDGGPSESVERVAFVTATSVIDLGAALGVWEVKGDKRSLLLATDLEKRGGEITLTSMSVCAAFSRELGAALNGLDGSVELKIAAVGAGALGSQVAMNLVRAGWGRWTIFDNDELLPHNLARHVLGGAMVGWNKSRALASELNNLFQEDKVAAGKPGDVLHGGAIGRATAAVLASADLILDLSASPAVARHLARAEGAARRFSVFLAPSGNDLVLLAEDQKRRTPLNILEMAYYAAVARLESLRGHLEVEGGEIRYGLSCRDVSSRLPQDSVSLFAAVASKAIKRFVNDPEAQVRIWRMNPATFTVNLVAVKLEGFSTFICGEWTVALSNEVTRDIRAQRLNRLPRETGGILVGAADHDRMILYVMMALESPADSEECRTHYIRGCKALKQQLTEIQMRTVANLGYVGEWHSHPDGFGISPSSDDRRVFAWIGEHTRAEGKPPVMVITGERGAVRVIVGSITETDICEEFVP